MSIATEPTHRLVFPIRPRLVDSLSRLRRTIRTYVLVESLAMLVTAACTWFWLTFLFDWGLLFGTFGVDYLRDGAPTIVGIFQGVFTGSLLIALGYVVIMKVLFRLFASFDEAALALVLERKFSGELGDRLATAVELSDPRQTIDAGYSSYMIEETSQEAADRLSRLPVGRVFNWERLTKWCFLAVGLLLSLAVLGYTRTDAAALGVERNLLLRDVYWPRQTMVELLDFPASGVKAVPMGSEMKLSVRAWKWVRSTSATPDGWRQLLWEDFGFDSARRAKVPWELLALTATDDAEDLFMTLPESWKKLCLDEVELRVKAATVGTANESQAIRQELGLAAVAWGKEFAKPHSFPTGLMPEAWRHFESRIPFNEHLMASEKLSPTIVERLLKELHGRPTLPADSVQWFIQGWSPVKPVILSNAAVLQLFNKLQPRSSVNGLTQADLDLLPSDWRKLNAKDLSARLERFSKEETPIRIGQLVLQQLAAFFEELESRSAIPHMGRRTEFRRLYVPEEITVEFEQVLTDEERARSKPKIGQPKVRRIPDTADFSYDFKKLDRTVRFRILAGDTAVHWKRIEVVPLPTLRKLARYHEEPGYLHVSNSAVQKGPYSISLEGDESRFDVPAGTAIKLEGECDKPLRELKVFDQNHDAATAKPMVAAQRNGEYGFEVVLPVVEKEESKLRLEFEDTDGIVGVRRLVVGVIEDRPPEFVHASFEVVRREMISPDAVIPFNGRIRDEHGLMAVAYDVRVLTPDGAAVYTRRIPFRRFLPLQDSPARIESMKDLTISRLSAGSRWIHGWRQFSLGRMPLAGPIGLYDIPPLEVIKEHGFEFPYRPPEQPVFSPAEDEYLDSQLIQRLFETEKTKAKWPPTPYRLSVQLAARDNFVGKGPDGKPIFGQENRSPEAFEFQVIDADGVVIEAGRREEDLSDKFEGIITNLKKARKSLQRMYDDFENVKSAEDFRRTAADCQEVSRTIKENRDATDRDVSREFRMIFRELVLNRCSLEALDRLKKICGPLEVVIARGQEFDRAEAAATALATRLETEMAGTPAAAFRPAIDAADRLIARLEAIHVEMKKLLAFNQILAAFRELINFQDRLNKRNEEMRKKKEEQELGGEKP